MSEPEIELNNVRRSGGAVDFEANVAGYSLKLRMSEEFVADEIGDDASDAAVTAYFNEKMEEIKKAAWALAYEHSTRGKRPEDPPGPVPYLGSVTAPFNQMKIR